MQLSVWTYEGPPHVGTLRVVNSMRGVHLLLHAPQGDTYADLLFTMIERNQHRPPVTYTTFQARHLGADTAELVLDTLKTIEARFEPDLIVVAESCTAELIQDQAGALARSSGISIPVVPIELHAYARKENWGASETFYGLVRGLLGQRARAASSSQQDGQNARPSCNILGPTSLGFRCRDNLTELTALLGSIGVDVNVIAPLSATAHDLLRIPDADFNICLYPEIAELTCDWLQRAFGQPYVRTTPIGVSGTVAFLEEISALTGIDVESVCNESASRLPWYSRSVDSNYLTAKRVFVFGDATHAIACARVARDELGFDVVGLGTYSREHARKVREAAAEFGIDALITDDHLQVERAITEVQPELILGTQMERHIAKRLGIGCAVIAGPAHVQDYPARYSPVMGFEGANVLFDTWIHPLMMGLEEHLLQLFRDDFEFKDQASHLGHSASVPAPDIATTQPVSMLDDSVRWDQLAEAELKKIPFFVRGKARRNTEKFALERGIQSISLDTLYEAKAHYGS